MLSTTPSISFSNFYFWKWFCFIFTHDALNALLYLPTSSYTYSNSLDLQLNGSVWL